MATRTGAKAPSRGPAPAGPAAHGVGRWEAEAARAGCTPGTPGGVAKIR